MSIRDGENDIAGSDIGPDAVGEFQAPTLLLGADELYRATVADVALLMSGTGSTLCNVLKKFYGESGMAPAAGVVYCRLQNGREGAVRIERRDGIYTIDTHARSLVGIVTLCEYLTGPLTYGGKVVLSIGDGAHHAETEREIKNAKGQDTVIYPKAL